ncbi:MAG TPA: rhodanese-like domain-containing protein [Blastocatellia bacterium]
MAKKTAFLKCADCVTTAAALLVIVLCSTRVPPEQAAPRVATASAPSSNGAIQSYVPAPGRTLAIETIRSRAADDPWTVDQQIEPVDLVKVLTTDQKPAVLQVGFFPLFRLSHIPGAVYAGPANSPEGLDKLTKAVRDLPKTSEIVLYCGCCPLKDCPNVRPAYKALKDMGLTKIKVLILPNNFTQDWVNKGYPVEGSVPPHKASGASS